MKASQKQKRISFSRPERKIDTRFKTTMKKLFNGFVLLLAGLLLLSCLTPFVPVAKLPVLSFLGLTVPLLFLGNLLMGLLAFFLRNRIWLASLTALLLGFGLFGSFYRFGQQQEPLPEEALEVMSFNTCSFNSYGWIDAPDIDEAILRFVKEQDPDIVCFQEFSRSYHRRLKQYPYRYETPYRSMKTIQAIFSKYPIVGQGSLEFPDTGNNALYADIQYQSDTLRVYNLHLQSYQVIPSRRLIRRAASGGLYRRMSKAFSFQEQQAGIFKRHKEASPYPAIVCGDLNNTAYSRAYRMVRGDMQDSFDALGNGFGTTYKLKFLPLRIDVILSDTDFEVVAHRNYDVLLSDHFPLMAAFQLKRTDNNNP